MFRKKKFLGQNFLSNTNILMAMIKAARISQKDVVLEVGPGMGSLTELLAQHAKKVIAIEKDKELIPLLKEKFAQTPNVEIIEGDILNLAKLKFITSREKEKLRPLAFLPSFVRREDSHYKLVSNIPYYLTGRLIRLFLESPHKPSVMVLMIQREVAERIMAKDGKESLLSISVKAYGTPKIIRIVPRGAFNPPPKVDSAILAIENISDAWFTKNGIKPADFFAILRKAFQNKRKMLKNSLLSNVGGLPKMANVGGWTKKRPEELTLEDWKEIMGLYTGGLCVSMR